MIIITELKHKIMKLFENQRHNPKNSDTDRFSPTEKIPLRNLNALKLYVDPLNPFFYIHTMYRWATSAYSSRFWQMNIPFQEFKEHYHRWICSGKGSVFIVSTRNILISQVDAYLVQDDPLSEHVEAKDSDHGIHFLMAPYRDLIPYFGLETRGLAAKALVTVLEILFCTVGATNVYAEPDVQNRHACKLAEQVGFTFLKKITLKEKEAKLYKISREAFLSMYDCPQ